MNEKVEQHIRKNTHKPTTALRFLVEGGVIPLYGLALVSFLWDLSGFPSDSPNKWYQSR